MSYPHVIYGKLRKYRKPPLGCIENTENLYLEQHFLCFQSLWNKIDLQSPILSHALSPNNAFLVLINHVSPNDFLFQLDYQHPVDTSVYTVYTGVYKGVYVCTLTCLARFNLKVLWGCKPEYREVYTRVSRQYTHQVSQITL